MIESAAATTVAAAPSAGMSAPGMPAPAYRADIDGLRAVAILAVIGFHAFPRVAPGGFVGVDVFFVISGFLISGLILNRLAAGRFTLVDFYRRRIRRIFPALLVVFAFALGAGWFTLLAHEYSQLGKHVAGGAGFVSNFVLWDEAGYFDNSAATKPLLHLWSLGVEEQFYLLWPLALTVAWRGGRALVAFVCGVIVLSFAWNVHALNGDPIGGFYSPVCRLWELGIGAALAAVNAPEMNLRPRVRHAAAAGGGLLVLAAIFLLDGASPFPGWRALVPTVGTALLIVAGERAYLNRAVLARPVVVGVGLISYPLYLWHWVLLSFAVIVSTEQTVPVSVRLALVALSVVLAVATYAIVEKPIRFGRTGAQTVVALIALMIAAGGAGYVVYAREGVPSRIRRDDVNDRLVRGSRVDLPGLTDCTPDMRQYARTAHCVSSPDPAVAILGDSHASHLVHGFVSSADREFDRVLLLEADGCWPTLDAETAIGCNAELHAALERVRRTPTIRTVVLASYYGRIGAAGAAGAERLLAGYRGTIDSLRTTGARTAFVIDPPTLPSDPEACLGRRPIEKVFPRFFLKPSFCGGLTAADMKDRTEYDRLVGALRQAEPDVLFYDPAPVFCPDGRCRVFDGDRLLYYDTNHLSIYGSDDLVRGLIARLR